MAQTVGGYNLVRKLGVGGSGTVWEAEDGAGNTCALKLLHPALADSEDSRARLLRESRLVNRIAGGGVAQVLDFEADAAEPFVVTEFISGPTLAEIIEEEPLSVEEARFLGIQLQDTLRRVHRAGVVHRDLKPSNVILSDAGPVLIDFGIADGAATEGVTKTGIVNGTPGYVSPELLNASSRPSFNLQRIGDWWAWSALLLSSMTGEPPFGRGDVQGVLDRVFSGQPFTKGLDPNIALVMQQALDPSPSHRISPEQVLGALTNKPKPPRKETPTKEQKSTAKKKNTFQIGITLMLVLALIPTYFNLAGLGAVGIILALLSSISVAATWSDKHIALRILGYPMNLLVATAKLLPGLLICAASAAVIWFTIHPEFTPFQIWAATSAALLVTYLMPSAKPLRESPSVIFAKAPAIITWGLAALFLLGLVFLVPRPV